MLRQPILLCYSVITIIIRNLPYAAENRPTNSSRYFLKLWGKHIHKATARILRTQYLKVPQATSAKQDT